MGEQKRILVVDDSELMLSMTRDALGEAGYECTALADLAGLDDVDGNSCYDLVLLDVHMPELYGDDIGSVLRTVRGVKTPIYLFSNLDAKELEERAREAGLDGFIRKQDGMEALVARIKAVLGDA